MNDAFSSNPAVEKVLNRVLALHPQVIDLSLERITQFLEKLGNPHKQLPPVIHIAGTNGKGSVTAMTRAILEASGLRVHVYTSPHLVNFSERIRLAGSLIADEDLIALLEACEDINAGGEITFFEFITAAAFKAFAETPADVCILEVGLGGRLDATNVIEQPLVTAITPVHLDHQTFLGRTLGKIGAEKAGIIKPNCPVIVAAQPVAVQSAIVKKAKDEGATLKCFGKDWHIERSSGMKKEMLYEDSKGTITLPLPSLIGKHQIRNAGQAIAILRNQDKFRIPDAAIKAGLDWVRWPARLQPISGTRLNKILPINSEIWLDGGHNPAAGRVIKTFFSDQQDYDTPFYIILGMLAGKDAHRFLKQFAGLPEAVYCIPIPNQRKIRPPAELASEASAVGIPGRMAADVTSALEIISKDCGKKTPRILITGSLYLAGEVLRLCDIKLT